MANLITLTAVGLNGTPKKEFTVAISVSQIKEVTAETKAVNGVVGAASTVYVFSSRTGGATIDYQVTDTQAEVVTAANA